MVHMYIKQPKNEFLDFLPMVSKLLHLQLLSSALKKIINYAKKFDKKLRVQLKNR